MGKLVVIYPDGDHKLVDAAETDLQQLRDLIGCDLVEVVHSPSHRFDVLLGDLQYNIIGVVDEEGALEDHPEYNGVATWLLHYPGVLFGTVVIMRDGWTEDGDRDLFPLSDDDAERIRLILSLGIRSRPRRDVHD